MIKSYERLKKQNKERIRVPRTVQDTIPVDSVYKDGIFRSGNRYTKSYRFLDINYKIASGEDKNNLFLTYSDLLNSFDPSVMTKITINNRKVDIKKFKEDILIPLKEDGLDKYRVEYNDMLLSKLAEGDDIIQEKYITVTVFKSNMEIVTEELLAGSERFNLVNVNTFNGLATHVSKTVKQSNRVIVKGSIYDRIIKYTIPCKCKYCEEMFEYDVVYPQYEVTATSVRQDVDHISKS